MLDSTDIQIIEQLKQNGRASMREIAEEIGVAPSTVSARFQKLQEENVITDFKPLINYEKLGFNLTSVIEIQADSSMTAEVADKLENHERVISFFEVTGKTDMVIIMKFIDREDLNSFVKKLQKTEGVETTETHVVLTSPKTYGEVDLEKTSEEIL